MTTLTHRPFEALGVLDRGITATYSTETSRGRVDLVVRPDFTTIVRVQGRSPLPLDYEQVIALEALLSFSSQP